MTEQRSITDVEAQACSQPRFSTEANNDRIRPEESGRRSSEEESIEVRDLRSRIKAALYLQSGNSMRDSGITNNHRMNQKIRTRELDSIFFPEVSADEYVHHSR